jgi:hypothetical protein
MGAARKSRPSAVAGAPATVARTQFFLNDLTGPWPNADLIHLGAGQQDRWRLTAGVYLWSANDCIKLNRWSAVSNGKIT